MRSSPPPIAPVPAGVSRPRWSVMIPTFNCAGYLRDTLSSLLTQAPDPGAMQIEVVDDCSTKDDPEAVAREVGNERVTFYRQPANVGATSNFNTCISRARGHLVHILHGDDLAAPGFYQRVGDASDRHPQLAWFACRAFIIDEAGALEALSPRLAALEAPTRDASPLKFYNEVRTPSVVVRRRFYEEYGGFRPELFHTADWEMWARAIARGGGLMLNAPLCYYRSFPGNDTGRLARQALDLRDRLTLAPLLKELIRTSDLAVFRRMVADIARERATYFLEQNDLSAAAASLKLWREITPRSHRAGWHMRRRLEILLKQFSG